jgi:ketosteroid isomerase-like protein
MNALTAGLILALTFASGIVQAESKTSTAPLEQRTELERLSKVWMDAMIARDKPKLEELMAPEYVLYTPDPKRPETPRAIWLDNLFNQLSIKSWEQTDISAHIYGAIGVVTSRYGWVGTFHGKAFDAKGYCTDVWRSDAKHWQVVSRTCMTFPGSLTLGGYISK